LFCRTTGWHHFRNYTLIDFYDYIVALFIYKSFINALAMLSKKNRTCKCSQTRNELIARTIWNYFAFLLKSYPIHHQMFTHSYDFSLSVIFPISMLQEQFLTLFLVKDILRNEERLYIPSWIISINIKLLKNFWL